MSEFFNFHDVPVSALDELVQSGDIELGRGNIISKIDIRADTGLYPIYSSSAKNNGMMGKYGKFMFDEEMVTWSVDGGGKFFYRPKHKFSVTNVSGYMRANQEKFDYKFLHGVLDYQHSFHNFDYQSKAHPSVIRELYDIPILPLPEQKKIASILTSVDEVIDNTQIQIDKLQDLKKATMNELLTKGIGHTEFKDSELGRIPKSWEMKSLSEISELSRGKFSHRPRNDPAFYDGRYPFLQTGDIPVDNLEITSFTQSLNDRGLEVSKLFPEDTLVLTIAATIGEVGLLKFDSCFPDSLVGISVDQAFVRKYFLLFSLRYWKERLILEAPESAQKNLNLDILNSFHVAVPPLNEQKEIESILISIQNHIEVKNNELSQTQSLKKSLMQDLLTGKVRVTVN